MTVKEIDKLKDSLKEQQNWQFIECINFLQQQIEQMKNCGNCSHQSYEEVNFCYKCKNYSEWSLK